MDEIRALAAQAVHFDKSGENPGAAAYFYTECVKLMRTVAGWEEKTAEYEARARVLRDQQLGREERRSEANWSRELERAKFLLSEALDLDEEGNLAEAKKMYEKSVKLCLDTRKRKEITEDNKKKLTQVATKALERAESIKGQMTESVLPNVPDSEPDLSSDENESDSFYVPPPSTTTAATAATATTTSGYTDEEKAVLRRTSLINGREYLPFMEVDRREKFAFKVPFTDKHGLLALSPKQKNKLNAWVRPDEFMTSPKVLELVDCFSVTQTVVSDCSFVASIAISAQYEKRFKKRLVTGLIFPQNRAGEPVYNPCGKYMVKLRINGVARKIVIDDYFPLGKHNEPLCSYSSNRNELWISLLEKAYMKVMGGYDFPGSNSNIDLYALTGWIPERVSIRPDDPTFNKDGLFKKIVQRFDRGDVLVTMATGEMSDQEADRAGLVPTHAYAMLGAKEVDGVKLFLLKNPWAHLRWKGNYSERDTRHWTPSLMAKLNYDPRNAQNFDNGVFWIDYDSLCRFFDVVYMNWNPALFKYTYGLHQCWNSCRGPAKDLYDISSNPQFSLELEPGGGTGGALWILLSRHITDIEDFKNNKEYITILVYKNNGQRVYYPFDPKPYIDGVRINSPHYLCQTVVNESTPRKMTLVVSQYEKSTSIYYTLRVYSTIPFKLRKIGDPYKFKQELTGEWKGKTAGGCGNYRDSYGNNPKYGFTLNVDSHVLLELKGPKQYQMGFDINAVVGVNKESRLYFSQKSSGPYRSGFVVLPVEMTAGTYSVTPTTFKPGQEGPFFLKLKSSSPCKLERLQ